MKSKEIALQLSLFIGDKLKDTFPDHKILAFSENTENPGLESTVYFTTIQCKDSKSDERREKKLILKLFNGINYKAIFDPDKSAKIEFEVLQFLSHNNISTPKAYALGLSNNNYFAESFIIMDFILGVSFTKFIQN